MTRSEGSGGGQQLDGGGAMGPPTEAPEGPARAPDVDGPAARAGQTHAGRRARRARSRKKTYCRRFASRWPITRPAEHRRTGERENRSPECTKIQRELRSDNEI